MTDIWGKLGALGSWLGGVFIAVVVRYVVERILFPLPPRPQYATGPHPLQMTIEDNTHALDRNSTALDNNTAELKAARTAQEARDLSRSPNAEGVNSPEQSAES